jgi:RNA polymerase sigma factor (sigma-70 family)
MDMIRGEHAEKEVKVMARVELSAAFHHLQTLLHTGTFGGLTDGQLVERFVVADVETAEHAFAALVARHGPMVLGVCRRILKDPHDAADAFQATFLVLVRKATAVRVDDSLGRWLYGVSRRVAMQARKAAARRSAHQVSAVESLEAPSHDPERAEPLAALDEEIVRLPAKYQSAVVLCDLEGLTHEAAARQLGCPVGTIESRLARGRQRLRIGLTRRGFASWTWVSGPAIRGRLASGSVPPNLANATIHAAVRAMVQGAMAEVVPASIYALAGGCSNAMAVTRIKLALFALPLLAFGAIAATIGNRATALETLERFTQANPIGGRPQNETPDLTLAGRTAYDPNTFTKIRTQFDAIIEKVHVSLGQRVKKGDALVDLVSTELAAAKNDFKTSYVQWQHDLKLVEMRGNLFAKKAISEQPLLQSRNDENKSRLAVRTSRQRLLVFGVPEDQIDSLIKDLGNLSKQQQDNIASENAKQTRVSPIDGIVVLRDVVPGNLYDRKDVLMVITPVDHLLVWAELPKKNLPQVKEGQACDVLVPFVDQTIVTKVDWIAKEVARDRPDTFRIRMTIPNPEGRIKANTLVRVRLRLVSFSGEGRGKS